MPPDYQLERGPARELPPSPIVDYPTIEPPRTIIIINTPNTYLYLTLGHGRAIQYGIGVGRAYQKREWPDWFPPKEMIAR